MNTVKIIKSFVILEIVLLVMYLLFSFYLDSSLPELLQDYLSQESVRTSSDLVSIVGGIPILLVYIISVVGLLRTKVWAKNVYAFSAIVGFVLMPIYGPRVEHAFSAAIYDLGLIMQGVILALLFFTDSSFKKARR